MAIYQSLPGVDGAEDEAQPPQLPLTISLALRVLALPYIVPWLEKAGLVSRTLAQPHMCLLDFGNSQICLTLGALIDSRSATGRHQ